MKNRIALFTVFLLGCAGMQRDCNSTCAQSLGGDWVVVQYRADGTPINCWSLHNSPVSNEPTSDGIYWQDPHGHLVHISGWYNRVQVSNGQWDEAANTVGVDSKACKNGIYRIPSQDAGGK